MLEQFNKEFIFELLSKQLNNFFNIEIDEIKILKKNFIKGLSRSKFCFSKSKNKYYKFKNRTLFNPFHSGQYSIFLYFLSNSLFNHYKNLRDHKIKILADKVYYLNKMLNGLDLFYEVKMPKVFFLDHPVGTVIGRAKIKNNFSFSARCCVGNNGGIYPRIGVNVLMCNGSSIIGNCKVGNNIIFAANSSIVDINIPNNSIVYGQYPNNVIKKIQKGKISKIIKGWLI
jgi:serine O-acetyltransferase